MKSVTIRAGALSDVFEHLGPHLKNLSQVCIVSDNSVFGQYGQPIFDSLKDNGISVSSILLPSGEDNKTLESFSQCIRAMGENLLDRRSVVIGLGGIDVLDVAGLSSALYLGGIEFIAVPTTLMSMVSGRIFDRVGLNVDNRKHLVSMSRKPNRVIIDPACLTSLPERSFKSGLAEVIKYGTVLDSSIFEELEADMTALLARDAETVTKTIEKCWALKTRNLEDGTPDEKGRRLLVEWGASFTRSLEVLTDFKQLLHGEATAIGTCCAAQLSHQLEFLSEEMVNRLESLCISAGLPTKLPQGVFVESIIEQMSKDEKASQGKITCIVAKGLGDLMKLENIAPQIITEALLSKRKRDQRLEAAALV